jgi:esterase/lipase superfamily enzyme
MVIHAIPVTRLVLIAASVAALSACAGLPKDVLTPVAQMVEGASEVEMIVVTTRSASAIPGEMFSGQRGLEPTFALMTVSIPPGAAHQTGEVEWPKELPSNPATDFATLKAEEVSRDEARTWFHQAVAKAPDRSVLIFIHGFNNRYEDAVYRFAQIVHDSGARSVPVLVTWPSRGSLLAYGYDRESTNYTRNALEHLFQILARDPAVGEVSILAHSMGNWLALEGLRQMAIRNGRLPDKFTNVMMAAPDVDVDVFRTQIADMGSPRPNFTLFVSRDDRALAVSKRVWGSTARLGAIDPEQDPYRTELDEYDVTVIDLTKIQSGDSLHHTKFAQSPEIVQLIGARLASGQSITDSHVGFGEGIITATAGIAGTVGAAAGLVIAAPVAVIDPTTRENYGAHVDRLAAPIGGGSGKAAPPPPDCLADPGKAAAGSACPN